MVSPRITRSWAAALGSLLYLMIFSRDAAADRRTLVWTYEAQTMERGEAEFEQYSTFATTEVDGRERTATELELELEIGMNDQFDVGLYQVFEQGADEALRYAGYKLRLRHWIAHARRFPLDAVGYLEYEGTPSGSSPKVEAKVILGRTLGDFRFALNPTLELEKEEDEDEWESEAEITLGASWTPTYLFSVGAEAKSDGDTHYIGPVIGHGVGGLWMALGSLFRLGDGEAGSAESQIRLLVGVNLREGSDEHGHSR